MLLYHILGTFGVKIDCLKIIVPVTGNLWNLTKETPQPERIQKAADFLPEEETPPGPSI